MRLCGLFLDFIQLRIEFVKLSLELLVLGLELLVLLFLFKQEVLQLLNFALEMLRLDVRFAETGGIIR